MPRPLSEASKVDMTHRHLGALRFQVLNLERRILLGLFICRATSLSGVLIDFS